MQLLAQLNPSTVVKTQFPLTPTNKPPELVKSLISGTFVPEIIQSAPFEETSVEKLGKS